MAVREKRGVVAEVPLARHAGGVAARFEEFGERGLGGVEAVVGLGVERAMNAEAVGVAAGEERGA